MEDQHRELDAIAAAIKEALRRARGYDEQKWEEYLRVGNLLGEAWERFGGNKQRFGAWCKQQTFGKDRRVLHQLRKIAEREDEARTVMSSAPDIGVERMFAKIVGPLRDRDEAEPGTDDADDRDDADRDNADPDVADDPLLGEAAGWVTGLTEHVGRLSDRDRRRWKPLLPRLRNLVEAIEGGGERPRRTQRPPGSKAWGVGWSRMPEVRRRIAAGHSSDLGANAE
jgi:hypothetical protein